MTEARHFRRGIFGAVILVNENLNAIFSTALPARSFLDAKY
jgi:hypothetical protein